MRILSFIIAVLILAPKAYAQEDELDVIISVANIWEPDIIETQNIVSDPIPKTYRAIFENDDQETHANKSDLISWHFSYGTRDSLAAALKYFEGKLLLNSIEILVKKRWLNELSALKDSKAEFVSTGSIEELIEQQHNISEIGQYYLKAAEYYRDTAFLHRAEILLRPIFYFQRFIHQQKLEDKEAATVTNIHYSSDYWDVENMVFRMMNLRLRLGQEASTESIFTLSLLPKDRLKEYEKFGRDVFAFLDSGNKPKILPENENTLKDARNYWRNKEIEYFLIHVLALMKVPMYS